MRPLSPSDSAPQAALLPVLGPLFLIVLFGFLSVGVPLPVISVEVYTVLGFSASVAGWSVGIQSLVTVLTRQMAGAVCDRRGPRHAVLAGLPLAALSGLLYLAAAVIAAPAAALAVLLAGRMLLGVAESLFVTGAMSWGIARAGMARTGKVMAWQGIALYAALGLGAPLGVALMERVGFAGVAVAATLLPLLALVIALRLPAPAVPSSPAGPRRSYAGVVGLIWKQGTALALATAPFAAIAAFTVLSFAQKGWSGAGLALSGFGMGYSLVRLGFAHLPDRFGGAIVATFSLAIEAAGQAMLWLAPDATVALAGAVLTGIGFSLVFPSMGVEAVRRVPVESRGLAIGGFMAFFDVALGVTAPLCALLVEWRGYDAVFLFGTLACLLAMGIVRASAMKAKPAS